MSLILEALKKSEANRRLGQAPDLGTPFTPAARGRSPLWAIAVIVLALGAGFWWWYGGGTSGPVPAKPSLANAPVTKSSPITAVPQRTQPVRPAPARKSTPSMQDTAARGFGPLPPDAVQRPESTAQQDQRIFAAARRGQAMPAAAPPTHPVAPPEAQAAPVAKPQSPAANVAPSTAVAQPPAHAPAAPMPAASAPSRLDVPSYYALPFATRKAMPELNLSMHVYTADPKQRFVILDGTRMGEGETTQDKVTVHEIRPDGVVLEFQGQRFFLPRDGN